MLENNLINLDTDEVIDDLQLKGLQLIQKVNGFKFGVDAVILSDFANIKNKHRVIDLCTGTGIIPFLLYGKYNPKEIYGLEIQEEMVKMAEKSVKLNALEDKITIIKEDLKNIEYLKKMDKFDVVTVNPPYKLNNGGIINPSDKLAIARHEVLCNLENVIYASKILLKDNGRMFIVHRPERLADIFTLMRKYKIEPKRVRMVYPKPGKVANIVLVEGQRDGGSYLKWDIPLYVHNEDGSYTKQIDEIYGRI
ncbi:tRNA1(Val) (adenine(37)-N6)-methyltransferase [Clostridium sp. ZBS3]|uniref:tRNA1(Val) (adenine(37)-N6)-methyltransferase n=1 Tax=Clostridium sp. ZBS3 TaxID=2949975 RepID=UPI002079CA6D|nr:tRNA1(Val) (adenine(37)-N6)-methyltransferase [Clostridium sp. ZBS3]